MDLTDLASSKIGQGYWWGAKGEQGTSEHLSKLVSWYGRGRYYFNGYSAKKWLNKQVFDCSGLMTW